MNVSSGKTWTLTGTNSLAAANFGGLGTVRNTGTLTATLTGQVIFGSTTFDNAGTMTFTGTQSTFFGSSSTLLNEVGAVIDLQSNLTLGSSAQGAFSNLGTLKRTTSSGTAAIDVPYSGSGDIQTQNGILEFQTTGTFANTVATSAGATTQLNNSATYTLNSGAAFTGPGTLELANAQRHRQRERVGDERPDE